MKYIVIGCFWLIAALHASTQTTAAPTVTVNQLADGRATVTVKNNSATPLAAFVVTCVWQAASSARGARIGRSQEYRDAVTARTQKALLPNEQVTLTCGNAGGNNTEIQVRAGVYADGTIFGDPQWTQMILQRRAYTLQAVEAALSDAANAIAQGTSREVLVQQFTASRDSQMAKARLAREADVAASRNVASDTMQQLFIEKSQAVKDANLRILTASDRVACISHVYPLLIGNVSKLPKRSDGSTVSLSEALSVIAKRLTEDRTNILNSKPALPKL